MINIFIMEEVSKSSPFTVMALAFIIAIGVGVGYYQFVYYPYITSKPQLPKEVVEPPQITEVRIIIGSFNIDQVDSFIPKTVDVQLGLNNKVVWINEDQAPHTVTTDDGYVDPWSGIFDSRKHGENPVIMPGERFEFVFTKEGVYKYHCEPHPWMTGTVMVSKLKF